MSLPLLRLATLADLDLLVRHRRLMWRDSSKFSEEELDAADPAYRAWAERQLGSGQMVAWVVEDAAAEGAPREAAASGCLWLQPVQPRPGRPFEVQPYLLSMFTEPAHRGRGHARRIVEAAMAWAAERRHPSMSLHASDFGRPLYEALGFERTWEMRATLPAPAGRSSSASGPGGAP